MKRIFALLLTACLLVTMFAACTGTPADNNGSQGDGNAAGDGGSTGGDNSSGNIGKDTVTVACAAEPDVFVPFHTTNTSNMDEVPILHNLYETPIKLTLDGKHEPLLATSWDVSDDGLTYTLYMRDDVYFHNGDKMTTEDVAWTLREAAASTSGQAQLANVDTVEAIDDTTVVISLSAPYAPFLNALCGRYALILHSEIYQEIGEDAYNENPIGTGPYKWVSRTSGDRVILESNEDYWGGAPAIKNVVYRVMTDINTQMISLENGDIDVLIQANVASLTNLNNDSITWEVVDANSICNLAFNQLSGPTQDINFRMALMYGINKEELNIGVWEGYATVGDILMAPSFTGHPDPGTYEVIEYDMDTAMQYLEASNYNGEEFVILTVSGTRNESAAQIVQGQLIEMGINCTVNAVDAPSQQALVEAGEFHGQLRAAGVSVVDADGIWFQHHSSQINREGWTDTGRSSPELDALLEAGRSETDEAARKAIYTQINNYIVENAMGNCLYYEVNACAYNSSLQGVHPRSLTGLYFFNDWSW